MPKKKTRTSSFVRQFIALIQGDDARAKAEKNFRKAQSGLKVQISVAEGKEVELEEALETAQQKAKEALMNNGKSIDSGSSYVEALVEAENAVTEAEDELETQKEFKKFLEKKFREISTDVEIEE